MKHIDFRQKEKSLLAGFCRPIEKINCKWSQAFTLTELLISIVILGILVTIALPNYLSQVNRTRQNEAASTVSQIQTSIAAYADEFGVLPKNWAELSQISAVMTSDGPAENSDFRVISLAGGYYEVEVTKDQNNGNLFIISAARSETPDLNVIACINLINGASGINQGVPNEPASAPNCG